LQERAESDLGFSWGQAALTQAQWHLDCDNTKLLLEPLP
jgi:hypothetical protein